MINPSGPKTTRATVTTANERKVRFTDLSFERFLPLFHELEAFGLFEAGENVRIHFDRFDRLAEILVQPRGGDRSGHVTADRIDQRLFRHHCLAALRE